MHTFTHARLYAGILAEIGHGDTCDAHVENENVYVDAHVENVRNIDTYHKYTMRYSVP